MSTKLAYFVNLILQFIAVYHHMFLWIIFPIITIWLPIYLLFFTRYWWTVCVYALWFLYDLETPARGSRNWSWYKNSSIWNHFAAYFPIKLVKTTDLPADRNYIMGCHPHGLFSIGAFTHLCTSSTGFSEKFPGLKPNLLTLNGQFWFPFRREIGIGLGGVESSAKSLRFVLNNPKGGALAGIVIGGAEEVLDSKPGSTDLNLMRRLGFCRIALETGASLVPSYSFGENDVYEQYTHPRGKPIKVERILYPSKEEILGLHKNYCERLEELFEENKEKFNIGKDYKDDVVASVTDLTGLFSRKVNFDNLERQDLLKLHQAIDYIHGGVTVLDSFDGVPRLVNWPILQLNRQVGHIRTCYTSMRDELADLFTRQKNFFVEKNVVDFEDWKVCLGALKVILRQANKLIGDEDKNGVPRLDNWPILDLHRQVGHLRTCYTSMRDELADLFTRQKKFFVEKNVDVDELKDRFGYEVALQGVLNLANKLIGDEDKVL
uniref:Acyltransferase n=1 Tax=Meloidogyne floridensis TaxID=298350 RepID=A0A915P5J5_9BILA